MLPNTAPFDNTGHPTISVPAGTDDRLPVETMFIGEAFDDKTVLGVANAFAECVEVIIPFALSCDIRSCEVRCW